MMYAEKLVTAVKVAGKVLREDNSGNATNVFVPFGSEYSLFIKNKHSVRVKVRVEIDGADATKNTSIVLGPQESIDFERFLEAGKDHKGLKFKFIERTKKIEDGPRGIGAEDGLIRIEYEFERLPAAIVNAPIVHPIWPHVYPNYWQQPHNGYPFIGYAHSTVGNETPPVQTTLTSTNGVRGTIRSASSSASVPMNSERMDALCASLPPYDPTALQEDFYFSQSSNTQSRVESLNDAGITVGGSVSHQSFSIAPWFATDGVKHVMVLKLLGQVGEKKVKEAVTVKTKLNCPTCGTVNKHGSKFCKECGTGLTIV